MELVRNVRIKNWSSDARLDGKTAIVTGANTGIGKETARDLARRGARVILACRDMEKAKDAANDIINDTGSNTVIPCKLDLADTKSICEFADHIYNRHFFLTFLLLDLLKQSTPARIINLSSSTHSMGKIQFDDLNSEKSYHPVKAYVQSKLANVLFTRELARRLEGTGVTVYAVDPGVVYTRAIRHMKSFIQMFVKAFQFLIRTPAEGAYTTLYCAVTPELAKESGGYYCNCTPANCSRAASDDESARKLWKVSCHLLGIRWK